MGIRGSFMTTRLAFLFPGQGSQAIGMGNDVSKEFPETREIFEHVDDICNKPISRLCFEGPIEDLTLTINLQPAITAVNLACLAVLTKAGIKASVSAGHSLGEYGAMVASGVVTPYDALRLVNMRGDLMHREALAHPGVMVAVLGKGIDEMSKVVEVAKKQGVISVANHNTVDQIVITGEAASLQYATDLLNEQGRAKVIPLPVSGAWHSDLMINAVDDFRNFMEGIKFSRPKSTMLFNATADTEESPEKIKDIMALQLTSPVRWYDIVIKMIDDGIDTFVEVGPKRVLSGLVKKIMPKGSDLKIYSAGNVKGLMKLLEAVK
jgi:[acyl-carrier-protein] S-malonyltransferase